MNKNLPKVFAVPIDKKLVNNKDIFISNNEEVRGDVINKNEINKIFNSKNHVYKTKIHVITTSGPKEVDAVGLNGDNILTLNGESIPIDDILEIKKV